LRASNLNFLLCRPKIDFLRDHQHFAVLFFRHNHLLAKPL
jgi:hypothetical protein